MTPFILRQAICLFTLAFGVSFHVSADAKNLAFEEQIEQYMETFPYQDSYNDAVKYTDGAPAKLNPRVLGEKLELVQAGADQDGNTLDGSKGTYTLTTESPPVGAFWSVTVYDAVTGGFLHPNKDDRHHINNTSAIPNTDGTYTFTFATSCTGDAKHWLEVPSGPFDLVISRTLVPR